MRTASPSQRVATHGVVLALVCSTTVLAEDWPQFRGPNRDGAWAEAGALKAFPAGGPVGRWRAMVGWGWSSPVVAQERVYITDSALDAPKAQERVLCFDEATGKPLWTHAYDVTY